MAKQTKITRSARGEQCQVRIPNVCNGNPETTVLAHLNGGGIGYKAKDIHGAYSCSDCHRWLDGGFTQTPNIQRSIRDLYHLEGVIRTQSIMLDKGLIKI